MTPQQHQAATAECIKAIETGLPWWLYGKKGGAPRHRREEEYQSLCISLWVACRKRQLNPKLQQWGLPTIFENQARSDRNVRYRTESRKYGIKNRDIHKPEAELLRQVQEVSINVEDPENPAYHLSSPENPYHDVEVQSQWEALTAMQRAFVRLKVDGCTQRRIADVLQLSDKALGNLVVDLKRLYGIESVKIQA